MITAMNAARYFLSKQDQEEPDISNLKLLKLLYYAQGTCLALLDRPLFSETIEAWRHGPVVPSVYQAFK
ncbi:Panacea domain-containing protein, partial [Lacticaseibacillus paracasei]